ncbi:MAG: amidohydrolase family protein [Candidatus Hodarchaeales archaeon]|jgi:predicted TIM-barrel fold metal-dependent hydrolase
MNTIDFHVHPIRQITSSESLLKEMDESSVSKAILLALDLDPLILETNNELKNEIIDDLYDYSYFVDPDQILTQMTQILKLGETPNSLVAEMCERNPDRFIGFGSVNPSKSKRYVKGKLHEIADLGLNGIKLIPTLQFFHPHRNKNLKSIFKFAYKKKWPIMIHTGKDPGPFEIGTLRYVKNSHPKFWTKLLSKTKNKVILAHLGGYGVGDDDSWLNHALELAANNSPNIYLDTSAVTYALNSPGIINKLRKTNQVRILYGSDSPVVQGTSMLHSKSVIENNKLLTASEKHSILYQNAYDLLEELNII